MGSRGTARNKILICTVVFQQTIQQMLFFFVDHLIGIYGRTGFLHYLYTHIHTYTFLELIYSICSFMSTLPRIFISSSSFLFSNIYFIFCGMFNIGILKLYLEHSINMCFIVMGILHLDLGGSSLVGN